MRREENKHTKYTSHGTNGINGIEDTKIISTYAPQTEGHTEAKSIKCSESLSVILGLHSEKQNKTLLELQQRTSFELGLRRNAQAELGEVVEKLSKDQQLESERGFSDEEEKEEEETETKADRQEAPTKELEIQELPVALKWVEGKEASIGE